MTSPRFHEDIARTPRVQSRFPDEKTALVDAVRVALHELPGIDIADLDVTIEGGRVEIEGSVADASDRDRIVRVVSDVPGVIAVIDTIRIRAH